MSKISDKGRRMLARIVVPAAIIFAVLSQAGPASAGNLAYLSGTYASVSRSATWMTGTGVTCELTRQGWGTPISPETTERSVRVLTGQIRLDLNNTAFDRVSTQVRLDRWNGSSWQQGYRWSTHYSALVRMWTSVGHFYDTDDPTFWSLPSGHYSVHVLYTFWKNGNRVGQAWESPTQANYSVSGGAKIGQTGTQNGYCQIPS